MAIGDFFTGIGQGIGRGLTKIGGYDPMQQVSPEEAARRRQEGLAALQRSLGRSSAILSGDPRRMQLAEQQMQMAEQEKKQAELNKKLDDAIDKSNLPQSQKDLLKSLNVQTKAQTLIETYKPKTEDIPADIKKLNQLQVLRTKFDSKSPNYDPNYTEEKYNQEASILGVSANLLKPSKEKYKAEYMKQMRTVKGAAGRPMYTEEQLEQMAESSYNTLYGSTPEVLPAASDTDAEIIDLGKIT